jgi:hypothetical protein
MRWLVAALAATARGGELGVRLRVDREGLGLEARPRRAERNFTTSWNPRRGAVFVAQWAGAPFVQGDGTPPLRVRLGRHMRR